MVESEMAAVGVVSQALAAMDGRDVLRSPRPPYPAAWPHRLTRAIAGLPVSPWILGPVAAVLGTIALALRFWTTDPSTVGRIDQNSATFGVLIPVMVVVYAYVERVVVSGFEAFRPALRPEADADAIRFRMAVMPAWFGWVILAVAIALTTVTFVLSPHDALIEGASPPVVAIAFAFEVVNDALLFSLLVQIVRLMREIRRVLAEDTVVDIFRPGPLHALSAMSARVGTIVVILVGVTTVLVVPTTGANDLALALVPFFGVPVAIALAAFVVPLYGTHGRLTAEKRRLEAVLDDRLERLLAEVGADVDARRLTAIDQSSKAVSYVLQERDIVARLSTWPWSTGTVRGFGTAILFPIALFILQRVIVQLVH